MTGRFPTFDGALLALLFFAPLLSQAQDASTTQPAAWLSEEAAERGLVFRHRSGHRERFLMPEIMAGGAALVDLDGDGDLDAYLVQSGGLEQPPELRPGNQLFRNLGGGKFEDVSEGSGAADRGYGMGVAAGDYDNDGDPDLYVTNVGPNVLLRNEGGLKFVDVTAAAGVGHPGWGASAAFLDYDRDGDLDLFTVNYLNWSLAGEFPCFDFAAREDYCSPMVYNAPARDILYRNNGDGTFEDVSDPAGLGASFGNGLGVVTGDFNADGWPDLAVANDRMLDQLWINNGAGGFNDEALLWGSAVDHEGAAKAGMGITAADLDEDEDLDLLVVNLVNESDSLYRNEGGYFTDRTASSGLGGTSRPFTRFGVGLIDFDNDGRLDLYAGNGRVARAGARFSPADSYAEPNLLFKGLPDGRFKEIAPRGGTAELLTATSRAAAFGDVDNDGGVDILVVNRDGPAHLLRNVVPQRGRGVSFRVLGSCGADALGAKLTVTLGDRNLHREVRSAYSYLAANDPRVHVGLESAEQIDRVSVLWLDGKRECFGPFDAERTMITLVEGAGQPCS